MTERFAQPEKSRRFDPPELVQGRRKRRRGAERCAKAYLRGASAAAEAVASSSGSACVSALAESTLREQLDAHARSLGEALISRQAEIDRREADIHAQLAGLESMRRELELWNAGERSALAELRAELEQRSARLDAEASDRRRELDRREETLRGAYAALERTQAKIEELQRRCEETMRRFDSGGRTSADSGLRSPQQAEASAARTTEAHALVRELAGATAFRVVRPDADASVDRSGSSVETSTSAARAVPNVAEARPGAPASASHDLIRLHEALLDRERFLADEARKLERERKKFAELRMNWIEERLRDDRKPDIRDALAELRTLREDVDRERQDRVHVQKRRHQRMQHLLEAIEDEITRLDIAWASVPQR